MNHRLTDALADDRLLFADEVGVPTFSPPDNAWLVLIVDDEEDVHRLTRFVLADFTFEGRPVTFLSAYCAADARDTLRDHPEVAVVLLDVVMEDDDTGLQLVRHLREDLGNHQARVVLRTGQPGHAPEADVVVRYDINDYKCKSDMTAEQLRHTLLVSLRDFRDIQTVVRSREGMRSIVAAASSLFRHQGIEGFVDQVLVELVDMLAQAPGSRRVRGLTAVDRQGTITVRRVHRMDDSVVARPLDAAALLPRVLRDRQGVFTPDGYLDVLGDHVIHVRWDSLGSEADRDLIRVFMANVTLAYRNLCLRQEIVETQKEIIHTLSEVVESRSSETANHVLRVGLLTALLGERYGLPAPEVDVLRMVAPMHDVGKVGISDAILNKPGPLDAAERRLINGHTVIGHSILSRSDRRMLKAAAIVALQHHERWDGTGYPHGLAGMDIHPHARITALADVFDALCQHRVYRPAMPYEKVLHIIAEERGQAFEPALVDLFLAHHLEFRAIREAHPDPQPASVAVT